MIVEIYTDTILHRQWFVLRKDSCTRIALLLSIVPVGLITIKLQIQLTSLHLRLLKAKEVGTYLIKNTTEALTLASPQSVNIPRNQFHFYPILIAVCKITIFLWILYDLNEEICEKLRRNLGRLVTYSYICSNN
jgi:hypothetical protein